jgi:hypothetical protein
LQLFPCQTQAPVPRLKPKGTPARGKCTGGGAWCKCRPKTGKALLPRPPLLKGSRGGTNQAADTPGSLTRVLLDHFLTSTPTRCPPAQIHSHCTWPTSTRPVITLSPGPFNPNVPDPAAVAGRAAPTQPCSPPVPPTSHSSPILCSLRTAGLKSVWSGAVASTVGSHRGKKKPTWSGAGSAFFFGARCAACPVVKATPSARGGGGYCFPLKGGSPVVPFRGGPGSALAPLARMRGQ